jgi:hypothetical protein
VCALLHLRMRKSAIRIERCLLISEQNCLVQVDASVGMV